MVHIKKQKTMRLTKDEKTTEKEKTKIFSATEKLLGRNTLGKKNSENSLKMNNIREKKQIKQKQ